MSLQIELKKSAVSQKLPLPSDLALGEIALNYNADGPFLTCKDTAGNIRKLNRVWVAATAPSNPTAGDPWLDTSGSTALLRIYDGSTWTVAINVPLATTSTSGTVQLASSADITNGTAGKLVDAAQLSSKVSGDISTALNASPLFLNSINLSGNATVNGDLVVNGTTTTVNSNNLSVTDRNIEIGVVSTPSDVTANTGGITLKGTTDKTIRWLDATDSWTSSEHVDLASGKSYRINGTEVLSATALGSAVQISSANIPNGTIVDADINASAEIAVSKFADGDARQLLQTDAAGTGVEWTSNVDVPGTLDVTGAAALDSTLNVAGLASLDGGIDVDGAFTVANTNGNVATSGTLGVTGQSTLASAAISDLTSGRVVLAGTSGELEDNAGLTFNGTRLDVDGNVVITGDLDIDSGGVFYDASTNRLAVGTTSPNKILHLSSSDPIIQLTDTDTAVNSQVGIVGDDLFISNDFTAAGASSSIQFWNAGTERARIDSSGRLLVGTSSSAAYGAEGLLQILGTTDAHASIARATDNNAEPTFNLAKARGSTGAPTIVSSNDSLGRINFAGYDGTDYASIGAWIQCQVDGTPGANDMPGRIVLSTTASGANSPTERVRISSAGRVYFNTAGSLPSDTVNGTIIHEDGYLFCSVDGSTAGFFNRNTSDGTLVGFRRSNVTVGSISVTTTATSYNTSSDYRLKENVTAVTDGITRLQQLKPSRFNFIADPDNTVDGFLAHEVQTVVPEAITGEKDAVDADGNPEYQGIDQSKIVPLVVAALQEAIGEIESLKARVAALEAN